MLRVSDTTPFMDFPSKLEVKVSYTTPFIPLSCKLEVSYTTPFMALSSKLDVTNELHHTVCSILCWRLPVS